MSEAIKGDGIRVYLKQDNKEDSQGTATWTGAGYTVEWDDGWQDSAGLRWHFGTDDDSLQLLNNDAEDEEEDDEPEYLDTTEYPESVSAEALNYVLYELAVALRLVKRGYNIESTVTEILDLALDYIAIGQEAERNA